MGSSRPGRTYKFSIKRFCESQIIHNKLITSGFMTGLVSILFSLPAYASDMEKVENVHAIDEGGTRGKRRLRDDIRKETVKDLENHTLAKRDEQKTHTNLERGRGHLREKLQRGEV